MKTIIALAILMSSSTFGLAINSTHGVDPAKQVFNKWTKTFVAYPQASAAVGEQGFVYVSFDILEDGTATNYVVDAGISTTLDQKALEIVKSMPKEHLLNNEGVKSTHFIIPIKFTIQ